MRVVVESFGSYYEPLVKGSLCELPVQLIEQKLIDSLLSSVLALSLLLVDVLDVSLEQCVCSVRISEEPLYLEFLEQS